MSEFDSTLQAFLAGRADFSQVDAALTRALQSDPTSGPAVFAAIDQIYRSGRLPLQLYVLLKNKIAASHAQHGAPQPAPPPPSAAPPPPQQPGPPQAQPEPAWPPPAQAGTPQPPPAAPQPPPGVSQPPPGASQPPPSASQPPPSASPPAPPGQPQSPPESAAPPPQTGGPVPAQSPQSFEAAATPAGAATPDDEHEEDRTILNVKQSRPAPPADASAPAAPAGPRNDPMTGPQTGQHTGQTGGAYTGPHTGQTGGPFSGQYGGQQTGQHTGQTGGPFTGQPMTGQHTGSTGQTGASAWSAGASTWSDPSRWNEQEAPVLERGSVLKGRFVLESVVGRGGMGVVFRARDLRAEEAQDRNPYVAIKVLNDEFRRHPESLKALQRESKKAQNLAHPNIATVFDFDRDGPTVYMQMEFLEGESLDRITKSKTFEGMPFKEAYPLIEGLGRALSYAHAKGIVHSDFKPGNCFLTESGVIKVFDFGIARAAKISGSSEGDVTKFDPGTLGALTPAYASCEMIEGLEPDPRDDIYALGCVSYELLTGRHPFNKKSAVEARDAGLLPHPVKGLNRTQARALNRSLAFKREDRSPNVDSFLDQIGGQRFDIPIPGGIYTLGGGIAAAVALLAGVLVVPGMLEQNRIDNLVDGLTSGVDTRVEPAITDYLTRLESDPTFVDTIMTRSVTESLTTYFTDRVSSAVDIGQNRYDYPLAFAMLDQADALIPDSFDLGRLREAQQTNLDNLLLELTQQFNDDIESGNILPGTGAERDIAQILAILEQASPDHELLTDPRLAIAYADAAEMALEEERYADAGDYLRSGLDRFSTDGRLIDLNDTLDAALRSQQVASRLAELRQEIGSVAGLDLQGMAALGNRVAEYQSLLSGQADPLLTAFQDRLYELVSANIDDRLDARAWQDADGLIADFGGLLRDADRQTGIDRIASARAEFDDSRNTLLADINTAATDGRMSDAIDSLGTLTELGADATTMDRARLSIERAFATLAFDARSRGALDEADGIVADGLAFAANSTILLDERSAIEEARQIANLEDAEAAAEARAAQVRTLRSRIETALQPGGAFGTDEAAAVLTDIDRLASLDATDALVVDGRTEVASKLAVEVRSIGSQNRFDDALGMLDDAVDLVGDLEVLSSTRALIESNRDAYEATRLEEIVADQNAALDDLLASPTYDTAWESSVRDLLASLGRRLPAGDSTVDNARSRVGDLYIARATQMRTQDRLSEAERLLDVAEGFAPGHEALDAERAQLQARVSATEAQRVADAESARIQGLRTFFTTAANANDIGEARARLDELRGLLPADDEFLVTTAPRTLAGIFERMARGAFTDADYDRAERLVEQGLAEVPGFAALQSLRAEIVPARLQSNVRTLSGLIVSGPYDDPDRGRDLLGAITDDAGDQFQTYETQLLASVERRVASNGPDPAFAEFANSVFDRVVVVAPAPVQTGRACTAELAGRGNASGRRGECYDEFADGTEGPRLIVVPAGASFSQPFAIGRYEIAVTNWNAYCRLSGNCTEVPGNAAEPLAGVSLQDAQQYAGWLSDVTGGTYRLPTVEEWRYVATQPREGAVDDNCVAAGRGNAPRSVAQGNANAWGAMNLFGNVQEWVTSGSGVQAMGGHYRNRLDDCGADHAEPQNGTPDEVTGFRLVREIQ